MRVRTLSRALHVPVPLADVFAFFSKAENLEKLTPASLRFEIVTSTPIEMKPGAMIAYRLRLFGVPFRWLSEITVWEPGVRFVDVQRNGPYLLWEHEHTFESVPEGTVIRDNLRYALPGGPLEPLIFHLFVRRQVEGIFDYRETKVEGIFGSDPLAGQTLDS